MQFVYLQTLISKRRGVVRKKNFRLPPVTTHGTEYSRTVKSHAEDIGFNFDFYITSFMKLTVVSKYSSFLMEPDMFDRSGITGVILPATNLTALISFYSRQV